MIGPVHWPQLERRAADPSVFFYTTTGPIRLEVGPQAVPGPSVAPRFEAGMGSRVPAKQGTRVKTPGRTQFAIAGIFRTNSSFVNC